MFERLVNETASNLRLPTSSVSTVLQELLSLVGNERTGGVEGFIGRFRRAGIGDVITSWYGGRQGKVITAEHLEAALGASSLDTIARASALTRSGVTASLGLLLPTVIHALTATGGVPTGSQLSALLGFTPAQPSAPVLPGAAAVVPESRGVSRWFAWAIGAFVVALLGLWLQHPPGTIDPQLTISNRDGKVTYAGLVRDTTTETAIGRALAATFGESNVRGNLRVDSNVKHASWLPRIGVLVAALNVPGVDIDLTGDTVSLGGWLSPTERQTLPDTLKGILGPVAAFSAKADPAIETVNVANAAARSALGALGTEVSSATIVQAMNTAIINFASGSAEIPADAQEIILLSAEALKHAPANAQIEVGGHTDNTGAAAANLTLSQARADAVRAALVAAGAPAALLQAKGYGDTQPRATNDTEYGRFRNRRIEYGAIR